VAVRLLTDPVGIATGEYPGDLCGRMYSYTHITQNLNIITYRDQMAAMRYKPDPAVLCSNAGMIVNMPSVRALHSEELLHEMMLCIALHPDSAYILASKFQHGLPVDVDLALRRFVLEPSIGPTGEAVLPGQQEYS